ncbi:putative endonuclease-reverse transcriptase [Trichonephila clavipes]|nr:putative endonuclease-reverse transcriptase [Trichonephila clavipes]
MENTIGDYKNGFRKGRSTTEQIFNIRHILKKTRTFGIDTHHVFMDFKTHYDCVNRKALIVVMEEFKIPYKLLRLISLTLSETKIIVKVQNDLSDPLEWRVLKSEVCRSDSQSTSELQYNISDEIAAILNVLQICSRTFLMKLQQFQLSTSICLPKLADQIPKVPRGEWWSFSTSFIRKNAEQEIVTCQLQSRMNSSCDVMLCCMELRVLVAALWDKKLAFRTRERRKILDFYGRTATQEKKRSSEAVLQVNSASEKESVLLIKDQTDL